MAHVGPIVCGSIGRVSLSPAPPALIDSLKMPVNEGRSLQKNFALREEFQTTGHKSRRSLVSEGILNDFSTVQRRESMLF